MKRLLKSPQVLITIAFIVGVSIASTSEIVNGSYGFFAGLWPIIIGAWFFTILGSYGNAIYDAMLISRGKYINHPVRFLIRSMSALIFSFILFRELSFEMLVLTANMGFMFWITFDSMLNIQRGKDVFYLSTWYGTSWTDKVFQGGEVPWIATKLILFLSSLLILIS